MKILIIGNGFDLEHGLPTRYTDFLSITFAFMNKAIKTGDLKIDNHRAMFISALERNGLEDEFTEIVSGNAWLAYFMNRLEFDKLNEANWIDFEGEISKVIAAFEKQIMSEDYELIVMKQAGSYEALQSLADAFIHAGYADENPVGKSNIAGGIIEKPYITPFIEFLYQELRRFIRAFEIYCICLANDVNSGFADTNDIKALARRIKELKQSLAQAKVNSATMVEVERSEHSYKSTSLKNAEQMIEEMEEKYNNLCVLKKQDFDCVLSFNYTNTYEVLYGADKTKHCYIHGLAQLDAAETNIILGIDDALSREKMNSVFVFVKFKKYFQRISLKTGSEYRDWIKSMKNAAGKREVYIVGHSMGATDHEILREFFELTQCGVRINVYYHDEASKINLIERTIEIIGKEKVINQVHGEDRTICFVDQYDEKNGLFQIEHQYSGLK